MCGSRLRSQSRGGGSGALRGWIDAPNDVGFIALTPVSFGAHLPSRAMHLLYLAAFSSALHRAPSRRSLRSLLRLSPRFTFEPYTAPARARHTRTAPCSNDPSMYRTRTQRWVNRSVKSYAPALVEIRQLVPWRPAAGFSPSDVTHRWPRTQPWTLTRVSDGMRSTCAAPYVCFLLQTGGGVAHSA
jgi:hypothetical protein